MSEMTGPYLTLDDVLLVPQYSKIESRDDVSLKTRLAPGLELDLPIIAANMDSVCEADMAIAMGRNGGLGVIHRYMPVEAQCAQVRAVVASLRDKPVAAAVGAKNGTVEHVAKLLDAGASVIVVDVAHGHHKAVIQTIQKIKNTKAVIIAGNVATLKGAVALWEAGADVIKVGVGPGSVCTTRMVTGHGVPQLFAVAQCTMTVLMQDEMDNIPIIADGGVRNSGDIVKLLATGAKAVMVGSLLAGTTESPGEVFADAKGESTKMYRGMSSADAQKAFFGNHSDAPEGVAISVPYKGSVEPILAHLAAGIRSGLSYSGATTLEDLRKKAQWIRISEAGKAESRALSAGE
jgi:IMP dehydrogenase